MRNHAGKQPSDATNFPVDVDLPERTFFFRKVTRASLSQTAFLDGRKRFWTGGSVALTFPSGRLESSPGPWRFILHTGFCGSTLLASVLDQPRRTLVLREPHVLAAIAAQAKGSDETTSFLWEATALLHRRFDAEEAIILKPTNWFNSLVPLLPRAPQAVLPIFLSSRAEDYLVAAFRGGRERIAFLIRLAGHLTKSMPHGPALWQAATALPLPPLEKAARLILLARSLQHDLFRDAMEQGDWSEDRWIDFQDLQDDLTTVAWKASKLLNLQLDRCDLEVACARLAKRNVKANTGTYSAARRTVEDEEVLSQHRTHFTPALAWAESTLSD